MIYVAGGNAYRLVRNHKNGWNPEAFRERYCDVLERYDYIVGDWGYNQLRLKGFFRDNHPKATKETAISGLADYLSEYCNFGCAWFVLAKVDRKQLSADEQVVSVDPPVSAYIGEESQKDGGQGLPMRWRAGGTTYVPHISAYDLARAQAEMEKRRAAANTAASSRENGRNGGGAGSGAGGFRSQEERRPNGGANRAQNAHGGQHADGSKAEEKLVRTHAHSPQQGKGGGQGDARAKRQQGNFRPNQPRDAAPSRAAEPEPASGRTNAAAASVQQGRQEESEPAQGRPGEGRSGEGRSGSGRGGHSGRRHRHKRRQGKSFQPPSETSRTDK